MVSRHSQPATRNAFHSLAFYVLVLLPHSWNWMLTISAFISLQGILKDCKSHSFYDYLLAAGTVCALPGMTWYITGIRKVQACFQCYVPGHFQCLCWCRWKVLYFVRRVKTCEVDGYIGTKVFVYPFAHIPELLLTVIQCRYHEHDNFEPYTCLFYSGKGFKNRF